MVFPLQKGTSLAGKQSKDEVMNQERSANWSSFKFVELVTVKSVSKILLKGDTVHKLVAEQIYMDINPSFVTTKSKWITGIDGNVSQIVVPKKKFRNGGYYCQMESCKQLFIYWKSEELEFEVGKNAIEVNITD